MPRGHHAGEDVLVTVAVDVHEPAAAVAVAAVLAAGLVSGAEVPVRNLTGCAYPVLLRWLEGQTKMQFMTSSLLLES